MPAPSPCPCRGNSTFTPTAGLTAQADTVDVRGVVLGYYTDALAARVAALEATITPPQYQTCTGTYWTEHLINDTYRNEAMWTFSEGGVFEVVTPELETSSQDGAWEAVAYFQVQVTYLGFEFSGPKPWVVSPPPREDLFIFRWDRLIEFSPDCTTLDMTAQQNRHYEPADGTANGPPGKDPTDPADGTLNKRHRSVTGRLLTVETDLCPDWYEPDDSLSWAEPIIAGVPKDHSICPIGDDNWSTFTLAEESSVILETSGGPGFDTRMWLRDPAGTQIEFNDDIDSGTGDFYSLIDRECGVDALPAGTYYVEVDEYSDDAEIDAYVLTLTTSAFPYSRRRIPRNRTPPGC